MKPSGTVTFMFTDVEGSTRLWAEDSNAMSASLLIHDTIVRDVIETRGGYVFSTAGDSFAAAFTRASTAVDAASELQAALVDATWPGPRLRVRVGLHLGEAEERGGDYFGPAVNTTARVHAAGHGGQTLLTEAVRVASRRIGTIDLGLHRLRDVEEPLHLHQLGDAEFPPLRASERFEVAPTTSDLPRSWIVVTEPGHLPRTVSLSTNSPSDVTSDTKVSTAICRYATTRPSPASTRSSSRRPPGGASRRPTRPTGCSSTVSDSRPERSTCCPRATSCGSGERTALTFHTVAAHADDRSSTEKARPIPDLTPDERRILLSLCSPVLDGDTVTPPSTVQDSRIGSRRWPRAPVHEQLDALYAKFDVADGTRTPGSARERRTVVRCHSSRRPAIAARDAVTPSADDSAEPTDESFGREGGNELVGGRFEVLGRLGGGGEAEVLLARDRELELDVVLKTRIVVDTDDLRQLRREAATLMRIVAHPGLPVVRSDLVEGDRYYMISDRVDGRDLHERVTAQSGGLPLPDVLALVDQIAETLDHLHGQRPIVVHGDLKPENVVVTPDGRAVLIDFGAAMRVGDDRERLGTPGFSAPEVLSGDDVGAAADIYSLAAVTVFLLTGIVPRLGTTWPQAIADRSLTRLERVIRRGLMWDPLGRPWSATDFSRTLRDAAEMEIPSGTVTLMLVRPCQGSEPADSHAVLESIERSGGRHVDAVPLPQEQSLFVFSRVSDAAAAAFDTRGSPRPPDLAAHRRPRRHHSATLQQLVNETAGVERRVRHRLFTSGQDLVGRRSVAGLSSDRRRSDGDLPCGTDRDG